MNMPQDRLDALRALAGRIKAAASQATRAQGDRRSELLEQAVMLAANLEARLEQAGARRPASVPEAHSVPLRLLDTPANRRYAEALRAAWEAGQAVDRERQGEGIGTDGCAQIIGMVLADVEEEIGGPVGAPGE